MDELSAIRTFTRVVDAGSFSVVARELNVSVSSVTRHVNSLEEALGVRLLSRSTRRLTLTEAGTEYFQRAMAIVRDVELARAAATGFQDDVKGTITVHAVASAGTEVIVPALRGFLADYPHLRVDLTLTDEKADLLAKGVDIAVWLGNLQDSNLIARTLSMGHRFVCASPAYFRQHGVPQEPKDLLAHNCLVYRSSEYLGRWRFVKDGETQTISVTGNVQSGNGAVLLGCACEGMGIAVMPTWMANASRARGLLEVALSEYRVFPAEHDDNALYLVYPQRKRLPQKVRIFADFLIRLFQE